MISLRSDVCSMTHSKPDQSDRWLCCRAAMVTAPSFLFAHWLNHSQSSFKKERKRFEDGNERFWVQLRFSLTGLFSFFFFFGMILFGSIHPKRQPLTHWLTESVGHGSCPQWRQQVSLPARDTGGFIGVVSQLLLKDSGAPDAPDAPGDPCWQIVCFVF